MVTDSSATEQKPSLLIFWVYFFAPIGTDRKVAASSIKEIPSKILINLTIKISLDNFME